MVLFRIINLKKNLIRLQGDHFSVTNAVQGALATKVCQLEAVKFELFLCQYCEELRKNTVML